MKKALSALAVISTVASTPLYAQQGISLTVGDGKHAQMTSVGLTWNWDKKWFTQGNWQLGAYLEGNLAYWKGDGPGKEQDIYSLGFTPVFRYEPKTLSAYTPFVEGGIGAHLFSDKRLHDEKKLGTSYQFGSHVGLGFRFGDKGKYDLSYRCQHFSNAGTGGDNGGVNFNQVRLKVGF